MNRKGKHLAILMFLGCAAVSSADNGEMVFNDWLVNLTTNKETVFAVTVNDSGTIFGEYCGLKTGKCNWLLGINYECENDARYPVLANSKSGAAQLTVLCGGKVNDSFYQYFFTDWKSLEALIKNADRVGFAFPMKSDQFTVVRFSMNGLQSATAAAERISAKANQESTSNQVL